MKKPPIGAHVSVAGGLYKGVIRGVKIGAECIQIFGGSPRRYEVPVLQEEEIKKYKEELNKSGISSVFIHASYLLNLASEDEHIRYKSVKSLTDSLEFADVIGAQGVIYHPGSPKGGDKHEAINREAKAVNRVLNKFKGKATLIIENTAGKKKIGVSPEEIASLLDKIKGSNVGVCIDTAHSIESGNIRKFSPKDIKNWVSLWKESVGINSIKVLHINDSKTEYMSEHDRHANIGEGCIGKQGFLNLIQNKSFLNIPWILEVPGFDNSGPDKKNIDILKSLF